MIENLNGIFETVNFQKLDSIKLYNNNEYEDYPLHWHTPLEIIVPLTNWYEVCCSDQIFHLQELDIAIITPGTIHGLRAPEHGERLIFQADCSALCGIRKLETILTLLPPLTIILPKEHPEIHNSLIRFLMEIKDEYSKDTPFSEPLIYSKVLEILVLLGRNYTESTVPFDMQSCKHREYSGKFLTICEYISTHCTEELTLDYISKLAGFSKYHFSRLFKQFTNISFYKFLNQKRIMYAEQLLIHPDYTITEVAIQSGFSSMSAFIRMFKQLKGCTPTEFRKIYSPSMNAASKNTHHF